MLLETYKNFTDLFLNINKHIIEEPEKYITYTCGNNAYLPFSIFECKYSDCGINLSDLCYTSEKIKRLSTSYINKEELENFKNHMRIIKGASVTYYFNNKKPKQGTTGNNGPCIISMVFTKKSRKEKLFNEVNIYYRTTEINRRFYADLVLFDLLIKEMPIDLVNIEKYRIIIPNPFFHTKNVLFNLNLFKPDMSKENIITKAIKNHLNKFDEHGLYNYKSVRRIQKKLLGELTWNKVNMQELKI